MDSISQTRLRRAAWLLLCIAAPAAAQSLHFDVSAATTVARGDETVSVTVTASNGGTSPLSNVVVSVLLPDEIHDFDEPTSNFDCPLSDCDPNETALWSLGTLAPGEARTIALPIQPLSSVPSGTVLTLVATGSAPTAQEQIAIDNESLVDVDVAAFGDAVTPGGIVTFTVTFANRTESELSGLTLRLPVPEETSFVSATAGGILSGGIVFWDIGALAEAEGGRVTATFDVSSDILVGEILVAESEADPGFSNKIVGSRTGHAVRLSIWPLTVAHSLGDHAISAQETTLHQIVVSNRGASPLSDVEVSVMLPDEINDFDEPTGDFDCPLSDCDPNETAVWSVGLLAPGEVRTVTLPIEPSSDTRTGRLLRSVAQATAVGDVTYGVATSGVFRFDDFPEVSASLQGVDTATPGETVTLELTFGNRSSSAIPTLSLRMSVPEGTVFESATNGGTLSGDNAVLWTLGPFAMGEGGRVEATFSVPAGFTAGQLLRAVAEAHPGFIGKAAHSGTIVPLEGDAPLELEMQENLVSVLAGETYVLSLAASNGGTTSLSDLVVSVLLPDEIDDFDEPTGDFDCPLSDCDANETAQWLVGTLAPGEARTLALPMQTSSNTRSARILRTVAYPTTSGRTHPAVQSDVLIGTAVVSDVEELPEPVSPTKPNSISVAPNPAHNTTIVTLHSAASSNGIIQIFDMLGRNVWVLPVETLANETRISVPANIFAPGTYRIRFTDPNGMSTTSFTVIH